MGAGSAFFDDDGNDQLPSQVLTTKMETQVNYHSPTSQDIQTALKQVTPAMRRALTVRSCSTVVAWERGEVTTQTMNRLHAAGLWVKDSRGGYYETKLGFKVSGLL